MTIGQMKLISWNVNGIRAIMTKNYLGKKNVVANTANALDYMLAIEAPDIVCLQEIRCSENLSWKHDAYPYIYQNHCQRKKGYSGTLVASKIPPLSFHYDNDGRIMILEYDNFILVNLYSPNTMSGDDRMHYRIHVWEPAIHGYITKLQTTGKKIIIAGDLNVIPTDNDMKVVAPISGSSAAERNAFRQLLADKSLIDTFRHTNIGINKYSWGTGYHKARLDFFLISKDMAPNIVNADILNYYGSDHRPILLELKLNA